MIEISGIQWMVFWHEGWTESMGMSGNHPILVSIRPLFISFYSSYVKRLGI